MHNAPRGPAPDYTRAFLVSAGVLCMMILIVIWAAWGFIAAVTTGFATDRAIVLRARRG